MSEPPIEQTMREYADNPAAEGYVPIFPTTLRKWAAEIATLRAMQGKAAADPPPPEDALLRDMAYAHTEMVGAIKPGNSFSGAPFAGIVREWDNVLQRARDRIAADAEWDIRSFWRTVQETKVGGLSHEDGWTLMPTETAEKIKADRDAAEARAQRLEADARRLDWLEAQHTLHTSVDITYVVDGYELETLGNEHADNWCTGSYRGDSLRSAIDAALAPDSGKDDK